MFFWPLLKMACVLWGRTTKLRGFENGIWARAQIKPGQDDVSACWKVSLNITKCFSIGYHSILSFGFRIQ